MRSSFLAGVVAFAATQVAAQYYANQSAPFNLVLESKNSTVNGTYLSACHEGAAIEGLCLAGKSPPGSYEVYYFNYSSDATPDPELGITGLLTWLLQGVNGSFNVSSALQLGVQATTNVATPLFYPGDETYNTLGFDKDNKLFVPSYFDDTVVPGVYQPKPLYRWYACITNVGYTYNTLAWVIGSHSPENPSCQKVSVKRVFV